MNYRYLGLCLWFLTFLSNAVIASEEAAFDTEVRLYCAVKGDGNSVLYHAVNKEDGGIFTAMARGKTRSFVIHQADYSYARSYCTLLGHRNFALVGSNSWKLTQGVAKKFSCTTRVLARVMYFPLEVFRANGTSLGQDASAEEWQEFHNELDGPVIDDLSREYAMVQIADATATFKSYLQENAAQVKKLADSFDTKTVKTWGASDTNLDMAFYYNEAGARAALTSAYLILRNISHIKKENARGVARQSLALVYKLSLCQAMVGSDEQIIERFRLAPLLEALDRILQVALAQDGAAETCNQNYCYLWKSLRARSEIEENHANADYDTRKTMQNFGQTAERTFELPLMPLPFPLRDEPSSAPSAEVEESKQN